MKEQGGCAGRRWPEGWVRELGWRGRRTGELPLSPHRRVTRRLAWLQSGGDEDKAEAVAQSRRNALRSVSPSPGGSISPRPTPALPASPVGDHRAQPELIRPPPHPRGVGWHRRASPAATRQRATGGTGRDGALPGLRALRAQGGPGAGFGTSAPAAPPLPAPGRTPAPAPGEQHSESSTQGLSRAEGFAPLPITAALRMRAPFCPAPTAPGRQLLFCSAPILARDRAGSRAASLLHEAWPGRGAELGGTGLEPTPLPRPAPFCLPPQLAQPGPCRRTAQSRGSAPSRPRSCGVQHDRCTNLPVPSLSPRTAELSRSRRTERGIHLLSPSAAAAEPTPSRQRHPCDSARLSSPCQAGGTRGHGRADGRREVRG